MWKPCIYTNSNSILFTPIPFIAIALRALERWQSRWSKSSPISFYVWPLVNPLPNLTFLELGGHSPRPSGPQFHLVGSPGSCIVAQSAAAYPGRREKNEREQLELPTANSLITWKSLGTTVTPFNRVATKPIPVNSTSLPTRPPNLIIN